MQSQLIAVVAIDFGTSRTGYAYGFFDDKDKTPFGDFDWPNQKAPYPKAPTQLLYDSNKQLDKHGWGYLAKNRLAQFQSNSQQHTYFFHEKFKMLLHELDYDDSRGPMLELKGEKFLVIDLIADYLRIIKERALETIANVISHIEKTQIRWCLTVPAIWEDLDKQLMREAARRAGIVDNIDDENLLLVLEPETAAISCQRQNQPKIDAGTQFMVVDCGGGTIDITVYRALSDQMLSEIAKGTGGPYGSTYIDKKFEKYLMERLNPEIVADYKLRYPVSYITMMEDWEIAKCDFDPDDAREITYIRISKQFDKIIAQKEGYLERLAQMQQGDEDNIQIHRDDMVQNIFNPILDNVIQVIEDQFKVLGYTPIDYIFLVGGFAKSKLLQKSIREVFGERVTEVIIPTRPEFTVLQGAVWFGLQPEILRMRKSRKTYGFRTALPFESGVDPDTKRIRPKEYDKDLCNDRFAIIVKNNESVAVDQIKTSIHVPQSPNQITMKLEFFATDKQNPRYIDEEGVHQVGELEIDIPHGSKSHDRKIKVSYHFGVTQIQVEAYDDETGEKYNTRLRFLTHY